MAERFFTKLANDVMEATETIATQLDDGFQQVWSMKPQEQEATPPLPDEDDDLLEDVFKESPLHGMAEQVMKDILHDSGGGPQSFWEHVQAFCAAINWTEPFVMGVVFFQVFMLCCTLYVCRPSVSTPPRVVLLIVIGMVVRSAEYTNDYMSKHWQAYGITQNYFDGGGLFTATLLCAPLLLNSMLMLICFLREAKNLLVQVKTKQILQQQKQQQRKTKKKGEQQDHRSKKKHQ